MPVISTKLRDIPERRANGQFAPGIGFWTGKHRPSPTEATRAKMSATRRGRKFSEEHKRRISEALKGRGRGRKLPIETRRKISESNRGSRCHLWKGGITPVHQQIRRTIEYRLWREAVFKRDCFTCQICGDDQGGNLEADHIKPFSLYPDLRFAIDNGRTLCKECHKEYGWNYQRNRKSCQ